MSFTQKQQTLSNTGCTVAFDNLTRQLYATDASHYQIVPQAVAFPRNAVEVSNILKAALESGIPVTPRGAGSGLVGGALGDGLIVEFARFNREISDLDLERNSVRVGAGLVLDQLNRYLRPHGKCFGPDVATSSRATLGGMIANNSSGARTPYYGTTADHVLAVEAVLSNGRAIRLGEKPSTESVDRDFTEGNKGNEGDLELLNFTSRQVGPMDEIVGWVRSLSPVIRERMGSDLLKRWPGYGVDRLLRDPSNAAHLLAGSEGTLASIVSAELRLSPLPKEKGLALIFFDSVAEAMQATVELLDLKPVAIEHIDRILTDQTLGQMQFQAARDLLELDTRPCESILMVEFYADVQERLQLLAARKLGLRTRILAGAGEMNLIWGLRKAGVALLTGCKGSAKPVTCIEDTAVRPQQLPEYVAGLREIFRPLGLSACFYGHAASGLLHVRPVLDLHTRDGVAKFRQVSDQVSALVKQFRGSLCAEHGVGIARTEYLADHLGPELLDLMRRIKQRFDPANLLNPGKLFNDGRYRIDRQLRLDVAHPLELPFEPVLAFAAKDGSFTGNLEQCNGCGGCRKDAPTMCPTFVATGEEIMSTRGRANVIRAALEGRGEKNDPLSTPELGVALDNCLSCKACTSECPSNVNMALLKAELLHARHQRDGLPLRERLLSSLDGLGRAGSAFSWLVNPLIGSRLVRRVLAKILGLAERRPLPPFTNQRFDRWFQGRPVHRTASRGKVLLWDDTFVRYYEPQIGKAAMAVLEEAGFDVVLVAGRQCCGRPAFSQGNLNAASSMGAHNLELLRNHYANLPILFLEPSCYSMFAEDYRELKLADAGEIAKRCFLFEDFIEQLLNREPEAIRFKRSQSSVAIHAHCHAKSLLKPAFMKRLAERIPGNKVTLLDTGCCGMAGAFGALESKYELSLKVAAPLVEMLNGVPADSIVIASGTSCRHQIEHLTSHRPLHMAEVLAQALF